MVKSDGASFHLSYLSWLACALKNTNYVTYEGNENKENPKMWPVEVFICDILSVYEHQFVISSVYFEEKQLYFSLL